jgi:hypothetical protein
MVTSRCSGVPMPGPLGQGPRDLAHSFCKAVAGELSQGNIVMEKGDSRTLHLATSGCEQTLSWAADQPGVFSRTDTRPPWGLKLQPGRVAP